MLKKISLSGDISITKVFCYTFLSIFIFHHDLSFGGVALKIEFVVFVYELINHEIIFLLLGYVIISFMMYTHQRTDGNLYQQPMHA